MRKIKITAILVGALLMFGQCGCPYGGDQPLTLFNMLHYLLNQSYSSTGAIYSFDDDNELSVISKETKELSKGQWIAEDATITFIINEEVKVYSVEKLSETELMFYNDYETLILKKMESQ